MIGTVAVNCLSSWIMKRIVLAFIFMIFTVFLFQTQNAPESITLKSITESTDQIQIPTDYGTKSSELLFNLKRLQYRKSSSKPPSLLSPPLY